MRESIDPSTLMQFLVWPTRANFPFGGRELGLTTIVKLTIVVRLNSLPPNGKLALAGQTRNCMSVLGSMLSLTCHLDDLCYFSKVTNTEISHNKCDFRFTNYKRRTSVQ